MAKILLLHGRKHANQDMEDWGFNGTDIIGVEAIHVTYLTHYTVWFTTKKQADRAQQQTGWEVWDERALLMKFTGDLLETKEGLFGDWELQTRKPHK